MTNEQKDAVIGRVTREAKEAEHNLRVLQSEAKRVAEKLREIASLIEEKPQSMVFGGEAFEQSTALWQHRIKESDADFAILKKLATDLAVASKRVEEKKRELEGLLR